ncbi:hypothetical protein EVAR_69641_1 [Eumeta japonica]|uniref:Uncharacterized protein n=1 Tax=Eumeta variegata TaxID=151549 RepID=A0A4C1SSM8_EUMVA|nr:hypothetical protein EVAR_69641_1 [Eumeta japonica]
MAHPAVAVSWKNQSVRRNKSNLIFLLQKYSPTVAAVSEIWLRPGSLSPGTLECLVSSVLETIELMDTVVSLCSSEIILSFPQLSLPMAMAPRDHLDHRFAKLPKLSASDPTSSADALSQAMLSVAVDMFPLKTLSVVGIPSPPW